MKVATQRSGSGGEGHWGTLNSRVINGLAEREGFGTLTAPHGLYLIG